GYSSDVPARARKAGDEARGNSVADAGHDNGYPRGRLLGGEGRRGASNCHDNIHFGRNQSCRQVGEAIILPLGLSVLPDYVLPFDGAQITQAPSQRFQAIQSVNRVQKPDPPDLPCLLRFTGERCKKAESKNDRKPDPPHEAPRWDGWRESSRGRL